MLQRGDLGNRDLRLILAGLSLVYGGGWFVPALLIADLALLRRALSRGEVARYLSAIGVTALVFGFLMPGMMATLGYPATASAILLWGFLWRAWRGSRETIV